jgi:hypothetical protein
MHTIEAENEKEEKVLHQLKQERTMLTKCLSLTITKLKLLLEGDEVEDEAVLYLNSVHMQDERTEALSHLKTLSQQ